MSKFLLTPDQNPMGRGLVQDGTHLYVMSECCLAKIIGFWDQKVRQHQLICSECDKFLGLNEGAWSTELDVSSFTEYVPSGVKAWGQGLFGLENFGMTVTA